MMKKPKKEAGLLGIDLRILEIQYYIAAQIILLRKGAGMTQEQLAKKLGTSQANVARMESGHQNFTIAFLAQVAKVFKKTLTVEFFD